MTTDDENAILKVGEFIRQTGNEVMAMKESCIELITAIGFMNKRLIKIEARLIYEFNKKDKESCNFERDKE